MGKKQLLGVQALRGIAFLGVFLSHTGLKWFGASGHWAVSIFLVLSGFMMVYSYWNVEYITDMKAVDCVKFAIGKIKKLYPLHICTMLAMLVFSFIGGGRAPLDVLLVKILANMAVLQQWLPIRNASINGVSWYLCTALFCYFIFPVIMRWMKKANNCNTVWKLMAVGVVLQFAITFFCLLYPK